MSVRDTYPEWADRARVMVLGGLGLYLTLLAAWVTGSIARVRRALKTQPEETEEASP